MGDQELADMRARVEKAEAEVEKLRAALAAESEGCRLAQDRISRLVAGAGDIRREALEEVAEAAKRFLATPHNGEDNGSQERALERMTTALARLEEIP